MGKERASVVQPYALLSVNSVLWYVYLALLVWISFISEPYQSAQWMVFSSAFYAFLGGYCLLIAYGGRYNYQALICSRFAIAFLLGAAAWLFLQIQLPIQNGFISHLFGDDYYPLWFQPDTRLTIVPGLTRWLLMSDILVLALFVVSISMINSRQRLKQLLIVMLAVGLIHAMSGIAAKYAGIYLVDKSQLDGHFDAARGFFVNRNHYASFVSLCLLGAIAMQLRSLLNAGGLKFSRFVFGQIVSFRIFFMIALFAGLAAITLSQSRAGFLGLLIGVVVVLLLSGKNGVGPFSRRRIILCMAAMLGILLFYFGQELLARFGNDALSIGERATQWSVTWQAIKQQIFIGYGGGSYATVIQVFREYDLSRQVVFDQSHNHYLHIWLEQGLIGLLLWLGFLSATLIYAVRELPRSASSLVKTVLMAALIVIVAALLQAMVDYNLQIMNIRCYFFAIMAAVFAAPKIKQSERVSKKAVV